MNELPFINAPEALIREINRLIEEREAGKTYAKRVVHLNRSQRQAIWEKTDGKCHVCGRVVEVNAFEADHVKNFTSGGHDLLENFLPSCRTCNNYRWHYSPDEIQWILKIGVWAKTQMGKKTEVGLQMAEEFVKYEVRREKRRKYPRPPLLSDDEVSGL